MNGRPMVANGDTSPQSERTDWLNAFLEDTRCWDAASVAPLDPDELIATACKNTGLSDFGSDDWRAPFNLLLQSIEDEADLHLFGRLWTRQDMLIFLEGRLQIEEAYRRNPEIDDVEIDRPVFVTGLPRSGTSILFELLAQDQQFMAPANWEFILPCPPPEAATYRTDPRVPRAHQLITQMARTAPAYEAMHEMGAWIPNECGVAFRFSFRAQHLAATYQVPRYSEWLFSADQEPAYAYYRRLLKLLQWRNPRDHWLLKAPEHQSFLPTLFKVFPDARVILTHRDPVKAQGSVTSLMKTIYAMRSDKPFDAAAFEELLTPEGTAARLNQTIDWIDQGTIPADQITHSRYADLVEDPFSALQLLYERMGFPFTEQARASVQAYLEHKPKGKFGAHNYAVNRDDRVRTLFERYQTRFNVPSES